MKRSVDVLADPEIQRHTARILELREEERRTREQLGRIIAEIGAELLAVKAALDRLSGKTAWLRWLQGHVRYSAKTAQNYMRVAEFAKKTKALSFFLELDSTVLYRLAALPDEVVAMLTPDTLLTDPRTGAQKTLKQMSSRELDRALDAIEGRNAPAQPKPPAAKVLLAGATRAAFASETVRVMTQLSEQMAGIRARKGALTGEAKQQVLEAIESLRRVVLKWPAWASSDARRKSGG